MLIRGMLALLMLFYVSCGHATVATNNPVVSAQPPQQAIPKDMLITLERNRCDGGCPAYKLTISADGNVIYEGRSSVKTLGTVKGAINQEQLRQLISEFEKANYFSLKDRYSIVSDGCTGYLHHGIFIKTSFTINRKSKSVNRNTGCLGAPPELIKLESRIDEMVNSKQWVG